MKIAAVTTYPPSTMPLSNFAYIVINKFMSNASHISEMIILADQIDVPEKLSKDQKIKINRCWKHNSWITIFTIIQHLKKHKPDIVWINLQYNMFGPKKVPAFLGILLIPIITKLLHFPTVVMLHDYYALIDTRQLFIRNIQLIQFIMRFIDPIIVRSICSATKVFVLVKEYEIDLRRRSSTVNVRYIAHDLYDPLPFLSVNRNTKKILICGYYGTYKRLEILMEAFQSVHNQIPEARLIIAGRNHSHSVGYLENLFQKYYNILEYVDYIGYVDDDELPEIFLKANIIVLTNTVSPGSSSIVRLAASCGRGLILPKIDLYHGFDQDKWGVVFYTVGNSMELSKCMETILADPQLQEELGRKNHQHSNSSSNEFIYAHLAEFRALCSDRTHI
jgi:glycosyltransferase involved in cell wall biosynthesis